MGTKNARKCNNGVRAYTPRSSTTGRRDTKANRARRLDQFRPIVPAWFGKRISAEVRHQNSSIFHHFPIAGCFVAYKCRRSSELRVATGSLGSFYTAIVRRPLLWDLFYLRFPCGNNCFVRGKLGVFPALLQRLPSAINCLHSGSGIAVAGNFVLRNSSFDLRHLGRR